MWNDKTVSLILPTYTERDVIRRVIEEFCAGGLVDEVVVCNNNAECGTDEEVAKTSARIVYEKRQGYGWAIQQGLSQAKGELLVVAEPDGTFQGKDIIKLLAYADDFEVVMGTRTTRELIWQGANMDFSLRWGNFLVAKFLEFLFNTSQLTDMGCTMKLINRGAYDKLKDKFRIGDSRFNCEFILWMAIIRLRFIEIPVNYSARSGVSTITGNKIKAFCLGSRMFFLIAWYFLSHVFGNMRERADRQRGE
ncbi:MAG: glycosyltransferase family 2 protein [Candidatus Omnitrophica bacterium]|nr:glycosyltransferase family 2 protein [Candidatus Omnitrophota bacterium]